MTKKRWISLYVENEIGVLARISSLFSGKSYNIDSLTVGETEDKTVSRMTISVTSDNRTFEQIKKQLNRSVEVIKVIDFTDIPIKKREVLFLKVSRCTAADKEEIMRLVSAYELTVCDYGKNAVITVSVHPDDENDAVARIFLKSFPNRVEIVRGGSVAIESLAQ